MSPEEQRIAIAEWCGYFFIDGCFYTDPKIPIVAQRVPDYLNDLNAIHEAEEKLSPDQKDQFANYIINKTNGPQWRFNCVHASIERRAEALLRTIGRWKDEP